MDGTRFKARVVGYCGVVLHGKCALNHDWTHLQETVLKSMHVGFDPISP
jgi:hypothetical protein